MRTLEKIAISTCGIVGTISIAGGLYSEDCENCIKYGTLSILSGAAIYVLNIPKNTERKINSKKQGEKNEN